MKYNQYAISMEEFVVNYLNIDYLDEQTFNKIRCASHQDLTMLGLENIQRIPFDVVDIDEVLRGDVIIVRSGANKSELAPYLRPYSLFNKKCK